VRKVRARFPYPVLLCDIGGTNVRLASVAHPGARPRRLGHAATHASKGLAQAIHDLTGPTIEARSLIVCAAGPVENRRIHLTNAAWTIDGPKIAQALGLEQGLLLNDFEAQAIMLPVLRPRDTRVIGRVATPRRPDVRLVLGPGTGLGAALLVPERDRLLPLMTEAGHMDFGPATPFEGELWTVLRRSLARVTGESLLSGPGSVRIYHALCTLEGSEPATDDPEALTAMAHGDPSGTEGRAMGLMWTLTARFAGGLALGLLAKGGVTLSGGVLPRIVDFLDPAAFRRVFDEQAPLQAVVERIPVRLVTGSDTVLRGLAALAAEPERFLIDYESRLWR
jgi:glucokinase